MKHDTSLPKGTARSKKAPMPAETPDTAKLDGAHAAASGNTSDGRGNDNRLARLEKLADSLWDWSERIFSLALANDEGSAQTAALAREAMNLGKGYATMLETIDQQRAKQIGQA